jgi:hypothetical protein
MHAAVVILATVVLKHPHRRVSLSSAQGERIRDDIDIKSILFLADLAVIQDANESHSADNIAPPE